MAKLDLNDINEGLRRLQDYEQTLKRIEQLAKSIAANLNSAGGDKAGLIGSLQQLQSLRIDAQTGAIVGGNSGSVAGGGAVSAGGGGGVSSGIMDSLERSRLRSAASYAGVFALHQAPAFMDANAQAIISGRRDPMRDASNMGNLIGGLIGGAIGLAGGPFGAAAGAGIGSSIGGAAMGWWAAPEAARQQAAIGMAPFLGAFGGVAPGGGNWRDYYTGTGPLPYGVSAGSPRAADQSRIMRRMNLINGDPEKGGLPNELRLSAGDVGSMFGTIASGLFAGGQNPLGMAGGYSAAYQPYFNRFRPSGRGGLLDTLIDTAGELGRRKPELYQTNETLAEKYTRRLGQLFGNAAPDVAKQIAPIFGSMPETGGNLADILTRFGPENTSTYLRIQNDSFTPSVDPMALSRSSAAYRAGQRRASIGSLQARGAASAALEGVGDELDALASVPGGKRSLAYAEATARARGLGRAAFDTEQITDFDIPYAQLRGRMDRANLMPFGSGNLLSLQFENIGMLRGRINSLQGFMNRRRATGNLSEAEELDITQQIEAAKTGIAGSIHNLGEGREYILPALTAGATRYSGRFTSTSLAAMAGYRAGSPIRGYGAVNGAHLAQQDALWAAMGGSGLEMPQSRWGGLGSGRDSKEIVQAIDRLTQTMERLLTGRGGGSVRPGEAAAQSQGALSRRDLGSGPLYDMAN